MPGITTKPTKKRKARLSRANPKWCNNCGTDITLTRGNRATLCRDCQDPKYLSHLDEIKDRQQRQRDGVLPPPKPRTRPVVTPEEKRPETYKSQMISRDGQNFLIYVGNKLIPVDMRCRKCKRDNAQVRGHWGPIYGRYDDNGHELDQVLLCMYCYDAECESFEAEHVAS
jgi:hypothetical protein